MQPVRSQPAARSQDLLELAAELLPRCHAIISCSNSLTCRSSSFRCWSSDRSGAETAPAVHCWHPRGSRHSLGHVVDALWNDKSKFSEQPADLIGLRGASGGSIRTSAWPALRERSRPVESTGLLCDRFRRRIELRKGCVDGAVLQVARVALGGVRDLPPENLGGKQARYLYGSRYSSGLRISRDSKNPRSHTA